MTRHASLGGIALLLTLTGCANVAVTEAIESADRAQAEAAMAARAANEAVSRANEALATAQSALMRVEQSPGPGGSQPPGDQPVPMLVPNSEYASTGDEPYYRVWFGTNRAPRDASDPAAGFSDVDDGRLHYGTAIVYVPESHEFGSTGSSWVVRLITRRDDPLEITEIEVLDRDNFASFMASKLATRPTGGRTALVYIHGYNTTFEQAVIRAAQMGYDLKVEGVTALYSWPSLGTTFGYPADEASIGAAERHLEEFLRLILANPEVEAVNVVAHSMGNRAMLRVAERLARDPTLGTTPINQVILAAPDVDPRTFEQLASFYPQISTRTTMYVSAEDRILSLSGFLHQFQRVGQAPPVIVVDGIDTIAVEDIDVSVLGHSYYAEAAAILNDIQDLLLGNLDPDARIRLRSTQNDKNQRFWFFAR